MSVTIGKDYVVYAFLVMNGLPLLYLADDTYSDHSPYPRWNPDSLFEIVDGRPSSFWRYKRWSNSLKDEEFTGFVWREWAEDHDFFGRLVESDPATVEIWKDVKSRIEQEHIPDEFLSLTEAIAERVSDLKIPNALPLVDCLRRMLGTRDCPRAVETARKLQEAIGEELVDEGFTSDWSPTERGKELETTIDLCGRLIVQLEDSWRKRSGH